MAFFFFPYLLIQYCTVGLLPLIPTSAINSSTVGRYSTFAYLVINLDFLESEDGGAYYMTCFGHTLSVPQIDTVDAVGTSVTQCHRHHCQPPRISVAHCLYSFCPPASQEALELSVGSRPTTVFQSFLLLPSASSLHFHSNSN